MSWIIKSSTTATSAPRGLNGASRSLSMNSGVIEIRQRRADGAIESLDVPRLHQRAGAPRRLEQLVGLVDRRRDRLLDQHVPPRSSAAWPPRSAPVWGRRSSPHPPRRAAARARGKRRTPSSAATFAERAGSSSWKPTNRHAGQLAQDAHVMEAECADADDAHPRGGQRLTPRWLASMNERKCSTSGNGCTSFARPLHRLRDVELRTEEDPVRALQLAQHGRVEVAALQSDGVEPVQLERIAHGLEIRRHVLRHARGRRRRSCSVRSSRTDGSRTARRSSRDPPP